MVQKIAGVDPRTVLIYLEAEAIGIFAFVPSTTKDGFYNVLHCRAHPLPWSWKGYVKGFIKDLLTKELVPFPEGAHLQVSACEACKNLERE